MHFFKTSIIQFLRIKILVSQTLSRMLPFPTSIHFIPQHKCLIIPVIPVSQCSTLKYSSPLQRNKKCMAPFILIPYQLLWRRAWVSRDMFFPYLILLSVPNLKIIVQYCLFSAINQNENIGLPVEIFLECDFLYLYGLGDYLKFIYSSK